MDADSSRRAVKSLNRKRETEPLLRCSKLEVRCSPVRRSMFSHPHPPSSSFAFLRGKITPFLPSCFPYSLNVPSVFIRAHPWLNNSHLFVHLRETSRAVLSPLARHHSQLSIPIPAFLLSLFPSVPSACIRAHPWLNNSLFALQPSGKSSTCTLLNNRIY